jgi:hypothetical protein
VYRIEVSDFYGNLNTISIPIGFDSSSAIVEKKL